MTKAEMLASAVRAGRVKEIAGLTHAMEEHERAMDELDRQPFIAAEKQRLRMEAETALREHVAGLVEQARAGALREFDMQEGELRAAARSSGADASEADVRSQVFRQTRARQLADLADRAGTPEAKRRAFAEALLTADPDAIRLTGLAVIQGLETLAARDRGRDQSPARDGLLRFRDEFDAWQRANPSPTQRLARIERARGQMAALFEESAKFALELFGVGRTQASPRLARVPDVPVSGAGLRIGPAFDMAIGDRHARR